jgi:hypothetical protein
MADLFEGHMDRLSEYAEAFGLVDGQVGAVFAINGQIEGLECFGHQQTFRKYFERVVKSYALDAMDWYKVDRHPETRPETIMLFLETLGKTGTSTYPSIGLGEGVRLQGESVSGAALVHENRVLHLSAFKHDAQSRTRSSGLLQRFSLRRLRF